jgi:hypothetical protein
MPGPPWRWPHGTLPVDSFCGIGECRNSPAPDRARPRFLPHFDIADHDALPGRAQPIRKPHAHIFFCFEKTTNNCPVKTLRKSRITFK